MAIAKKKSALEEAMSFFRSGASNIASGVQQAAAPVAKQASQNVSNFYTNFSRGFDTYRKSQEELARQRQQNAFNFAKGVVGGAQQTAQNVGNFIQKNPSPGAFVYNKLAQSQNPWAQAAAEAPTVLKRGLQRAGGGIKAGVGNLGLSVNQMVRNAPAPGSSSLLGTALPPVAAYNMLTGNRLPGQKLIKDVDPNFNIYGTEGMKALRETGVQEMRLAEEQSKAELSPIDESRPLAEKVRDPKWVSRGLLMNAPSLLSSIGLGALTALVTKNPAAVTAVIFGSSTIQNAGDVYAEAKAAGADDETATSLGTAVGGINGMLDTIGIGKILESVPGGDALKSTLLKRVTRKVIESALTEGSTESIQQIIQNEGARLYYDHNRDILAGVPESAFFGALMGGVSAGGVEVAGVSGINEPRGQVLGTQEEQFGVPADEEQFRTARSKQFGSAIAPADADSLNSALEYLDNAKEIGDFMDPQYMQAEQTIRQLGGDYLGKDFTNRAPINQVISAVRERLIHDDAETQDLRLDAGLSNNISKNLEAQIKTPEVQMIRDDMDTVMKADVGQQVVDQGEFRTGPVGNVDFDTSTKEAEGIIRGLFSPEEVAFMTQGAKDIATPDGQMAHGKYYDSIISVIEQDGKVESKTVYHEAFHAYADKFVQPQLYASAIEEIRAQQKLTEKQAIEELAEGFADFVGNRRQFGGQILQFFQQLLNGIRRLMGMESSSNMIYQDILAGKRPGTGVQTAAPGAKVADAAYKNTVANGGVTINLSGNTPANGFAYSPYKGIETIVPKAEFTPKNIEDFVAKNLQLLGQPGNHIGMWEQDGNIYMDVSQVGEPNAETLAKAQEASQLAAFDLGTFNEIPLGKIDNGVYNKTYEAVNHPYLNRGENASSNLTGDTAGVSEVSPGVTATGETTGGAEANFRLIKPPLATIGPPLDVGPGIQSQEDLELSLANLRKYRGDVPPAPPKQTGTELSRGAKIEVNRLNKMKEEFQAELDNAEVTLKNHDLLSKQNPSLANKKEIQGVVKELKANMKQIDAQIVEASKKTVPVYEKEAPVPSDDELALKNLQRYREETSPLKNLPDGKATTETQSVKGDFGPAADAAVVQSTPQTTKPAGTVPAGKEKRGFTERVEVDPSVPKDIRDSLGTREDSFYTILPNKELLDGAIDRVGKDYSGALNDVLSPEREWNVAELAQMNAQALVIARKAIHDGNNQLAEDVIAQAAKKGTLMGRGVQSFVLWSKMSPEGMLRFALKEVQNYNDKPAGLWGTIFGKKEAKLSPDAREAILAQMKSIEKMADGPEKQKALVEVMNIIGKEMPPTASELIDSYRYQNILSNPLTHLRNTYSNLAQVVGIKPLTKGAEATVDLVGSVVFGKQRETYFSEIPEYYRGVINGIPLGIEAFKDALRGKVWMEQPDLRTMRSQNIPKPLVIVPRLLEASDKFFQALVENGEFAAQMEKGTDPVLARDIAIKEAQKTLFRNDIDPRNLTGQGKVLSWIDTGTQQMYKLRKIGLGWFIPFLKTPMNVAKMQLEYSPVGLATLPGSTHKRTQLAKAFLGTAVMGVGATMAMAGRTTWGAPTDPEEKELFYATGRRPYSVLVPTPFGEKWVPMQYFGVFGLSLAIPAAAQYFEKESKTAMTDTQIEKMTRIVGGLGKYYTSQTYMQGIGNFVRMAEGDIDFTTGPNLAFTAGQILPLNGMISYVSRVLDPVYRKADTFMEGMQRNLPEVSKGLEAYTTPTGAEATRPLSASAAPYTLGTPEKGWEGMYKGRQEQLQRNAVVNKIKSDAEKGIKMKTTSGTVKMGIGGVTKEADLKAIKKNVDDLMEVYFTVEDPEMRKQIMDSVESYGVSFGAAAQDYLLQDIQVKQKGLSPTTEQKLVRSNEFEYVRRLRDKYADLGVGDDFLKGEFQRLGIADDDLVYDDKTLLADDVQFDQIKAEVEGIQGEELIATLMAMRRISEGSRKPLLTDTLIGDLEDEGYIDKNTATYLKRVGWDLETGTFKMKPASGGGLKKSDLNYSFDVPAAKLARIGGEGGGFGGGIGIGDKLLPTRTSRSGGSGVKLKLPDYAPYERKVRVNTSRQLRAPVTTLSGLGR